MHDRVNPRVSPPEENSPFARPEPRQEAAAASPAGFGGRSRRLFPGRGNSLLFDFVVQAAILGTLNGLISPSDPGWTALNPSPYLLMAVLLGARYGVLAGLLGSVFGPLCAAAGALLQGLEFAGFIRQHVFYFFSFPLAGILCGEVGQFFAQKTGQLALNCEDLTARNARLQADRYLTAEANYDLRKRLALHGAEFSSLDADLRRLFTGNRESFLPDFLEFLRRVARVTDAAACKIERKDGVPGLHRLAAIGDSSYPGDFLELSECPIADLALREKKFVTCKDAWKALPDSQVDSLAAYPWFDPAGRPAGVLLIHRMDFLSINPHNLARLEILCRWVASLGNLDDFEGANPGRRIGLTTPERFSEAVRIAAEAWSNHLLTSSVIIVRMGNLAPSQYPELESLLLSLLPPSAPATRFVHDPGSLVCLLPGEGETEAGILAGELERALYAAAPGGARASVETLPAARWQTPQPNLPAPLPE